MKRILDIIAQLWGTKQCQDYITNLLLHNRTHRLGFSLDFFDDLSFLLEFHKARFGDFYPPDPWSQNHKIL